MSFLSSLDISASGMTAQRLRLDIASQNIANIETTKTENGTPYRRKQVELEERTTTSFNTTLNNMINQSNSPGGVIVKKITEDQSDLKYVYNPTHPDANEEGYVEMPNVDLIQETIDGMAASRAYEANITAFNAMKLMAQKALDIGK